MKRSRILYLTLFFLSLTFVYFYGGRVPYAFFYTVLVLPALSLAYALIIFIRFKFTQEINKKFVTKGDRLKYIFSIYNEDFLLYPYINVTFYGAKNIFARQFQTKSFSLVPYREKSFSLDLECRYRGVYDIGIENVEIVDLLGLFKLKYRIFEPKYVTVYPRIVKLDRLQIKPNFISESHSMLDTKHEDMSTVSDIRNYAYGDSIKKFHWKLTAKMNKLMVKNFQSTTETSATIIIDMKMNNYSFEENTIIEDKVIESALAVIYYCLSNWIHTNLVFFKDKLIDMEAKNPLDFDEIYKVLSKVNFRESIPLSDILDLYIEENLNCNNIFIFTSNMDYELYNQLFKTRYSGCDISLVYISPEEITGRKDPDADTILANLPEMNISVYRINIGDDIKVVLER